MRANDVWFASRKTRRRKRPFVIEKILADKALQDTGRWRYCHSKFLDFDTTLGYPSRFLPGGVTTRWDSAGGVAQLGERLNGIQEVRGSIPLTSMACDKDENSCLFAGIAQLVEHNLAKVGVAGSSPVSRSRVRRREGRLAQLVRAPR